MASLLGLIHVRYAALAAVRCVTSPRAANTGCRPVVGRCSFSRDVVTATATASKITSVRQEESAGWYRLRMDNGYEGRYPYVWLRDNCRCPDCYHPSSWQRLVELADLDTEVRPISDELRDDGRVLGITWADGHRSDFDCEWLDRQRFSESEDDTAAASGELALETWGGDLNGRIPTFQFDEIEGDDRGLYDWLDVLKRIGLAIVKGAPKEVGCVRRLADRVAYLKPTIYGEEFQVVSKQDASNIAYTPKALCLHIDMPFYDYTPGVQMLHCIEQTKSTGGESQFVDGLNVAEQVRREYPDVYDILSNRHIDFRDAGIDHRIYHLKYKRPVIEYKNGEFQSVNYNDHVRAPYLSLPVDQVADVYRALKVFNRVMYRPGNLVEYKLSAGEIATFSNGRVLHGRSAYTVTGAGSRHLEGGYFDWDEAHSRMRILREKLFDEKRL